MAIDATRMSIDEQLDFLLEGTYFADEAGGVPAGGLREQMSAELRARLELSAKLREKGKPDWQLRAYLGVDPTRTSLHIGHMIPVVKLARIQQLGHRAVFLIGDYTAMIGDPTDQTAQRQQLTHEAVMEMARFYTDQGFRLLDPGLTEVRYNGQWLGRVGFAEIAELLAQFPLSQTLAREDFRTRMESGAGVRSHELLYSVMQGYDAFALNCDIQVGGYDQHFNLLAGRVLQEHFRRRLGTADHPLFAEAPQTGQRVKGPHIMLTYPLLMGTDGRKMSKSWGNTIDVLDSPEDMYGKVMRISDEMLAHYIDIAVEARAAEKEAVKARIPAEPMEVKKWIAGAITAMYNGAEKAQQAAEHFRLTVQEKSVDLSALPELRVPDGWRAEHLGLTDPPGIPDTGSAGAFAGDAASPVGAETEQLQQQLQPRLVDLLLELGLVPSKSEARRLIEQGGIKVDGQVPCDQFVPYVHVAPTLLQVGKRKVVRLV